MRLYLPFPPTALAILLLLGLSSSPIYSQSAPVTGTVPADQFALRYQIEGTGTPAIVVGSSHYYPRTFSAELREHLQFVFVDHRGFAPSPGPVDTTDFAFDKVLADIERTRQQLGLDKIVIIGHSGHAFMALEYAKAYPEHVSHVVMIGIAPDFSPASAALIRQRWEESVDPERKQALADNFQRIPNSAFAQLSPAEAFVLSYVRNGPLAWYDPHYDSTPLWADAVPNVPMFDYVWGRVFRDIDITRGLADLDVPVLVALGRYDYLVAPPHSWDAVRDHFQDLTIRVFERSGHTPQLEEAEVFDGVLLEWLERG
jgi:proline iminopeptidase